MFQDFKELLSIFNAHGVRYLVAGGYAVSFHSQPRTTKDLDLLVSADAANARAIYAALAQFGAPLEGVSPKDFEDRKKFFRLGREPLAVDILPQIDGVDFEGAWERRVESVIDSSSELTTSFISSEDLIASKLAAGRPQDLADITALESARDSNPKG